MRIVRTSKFLEMFEVNLKIRENELDKPSTVA